MTKFIWQRKKQGHSVTMIWHCFEVPVEPGHHPMCGHSVIKFRGEHFENSDDPNGKCSKCLRLMESKNEQSKS